MYFQNSCDGCYSDSLDVRFTKACDNKCGFCIEKNGIDGMKVDVDAMISSTIKSGKKTVLILGGEPLLEMEKVKRYLLGIIGRVDKIYLTTSLPITIENNKDTFLDIMLFLDGLNVSLQHYDNDINNDVLCAGSRHDRIELLKTILENEMIARKTRVSINLVKGFIDTKEKIDEFLYKMQDIGVRHVKINELQNADDLYVSFEKTYGKRLPSPYSHGCQKEISLEGHENIKITLKRSCFCVNEGLTASLSDFIKAVIKTVFKDNSKGKGQVVLYESGMLSEGWQSK